jgi:hypothetical protein
LNIILYMLFTYEYEKVYEVIHTFNSLETVFVS